MNARNISRLNRRLSRIKPGYLIVVALLWLGIGVYGLRHNNLHMAQLRDQVYAADKSGEGVEASLQKLRAYVGHHMNTSLSSGQNSVYPPIQLKYTYDRLIAQKTKSDNSKNAKIYTEAQKYCEARIPTGFSGRYRISCIEGYVESHNASLAYVSPDLYKFDFYSPKWAPDLAGWSLVLAVLFGLVGIVLWLVQAATRRLADRN